MADWTNKTAVITGAAGGIGAGLARYCIEQGMKVVACDLDDDGLENLSQGLEPAARENLLTVGLDVSDEERVEQLARQVFDRHKQVNLLFNNAGVLVDGKSWERQARDWQWCFDVNVMGVIHGIKSFVPRMLQQGSEGRVINTSSIGGLLGGGAYLAPYQGTKHMVTAITESLYHELAAEQAPIAASLLCPAEVASGIWESDRHRPESEKNELSSLEEEMFRNAVAEGVAAGLDPDELAIRVFKSIEAKKFWLLPQPEFKQLFELRHESIINETNPVSMSEMMEA